MRNLWIVTDMPHATWAADLTSAGETARREFVEAVLRAGAEQAVFEVVDAPLIGYQRERDGDLGEWLRARPVDLFHFTGAAMLPGHAQSSTSVATISWYDATDALTEGRCADLGALLKTLDPVPDSIPDGFMTHRPAVRVTGTDAVVRFSIHSDIWMPWVLGAAHPECDLTRLFDNRELARRHTPRLNAFLAAVADAAVGAGGRWSLDKEETGDQTLKWVDQRGVDLVRAPSSDEIMPVAALQAEWF